MMELDEFSSVVLAAWIRHETTSSLAFAAQQREAQVVSIASIGDGHETQSLWETFA